MLTAPLLRYTFPGQEKPKSQKCKWILYTTRISASVILWKIFLKSLQAQTIDSRENFKDTCIFFFTKKHKDGGENIQSIND